MKRWRINPQSIFDYDPVEDGKESISLCMVVFAVEVPTKPFNRFPVQINSKGTREKIVHEAYGQRQFKAASSGTLGLDYISDPAVNHKPFDNSAHPGFRSPRPVRPSTPYDVKETMKFEPYVQPFIATPRNTLSPLTEAAFSSCQDFQPKSIPAYGNFNRTASPFNKE